MRYADLIPRADLPEGWPTAGARVAVVNPDTGVRVDNVERHGGGTIALEHSPKLFSSDTLNADDGNSCLRPLTDPAVQNARASQGFRILAGEMRVIPVHDVRTAGRAAFDRVIARAIQLRDDLDNVEEFPASTDVAQTIHQVAVDAAAHDNPAVRTWAPFFTDLYAKVEHANLSAENALAAIRREMFPPDLHEMLQDTVYCLQPCERCGVITSVDADCGLCPACERYNADRVVI